MALIPSTYNGTSRNFLGIAFPVVAKTELKEMLNQLPALANLLASSLERKESLAARIESELWSQALCQQAPVGIALENFEGHLLFANPTLCSMLGYQEKELLGTSCASFSNPEDQKEDSVLFGRLRAGRLEHYTLEKRFYRKDGSQVCGQISISLLNGYTGAPPLVIGMVQDVTTKKAAEERLLASEGQLRTLASRLVEAQEVERHRISRELHDDIGQRLSILISQLHDADGSPATAEKDCSIAEILRSAEEIAATIHELSYGALSISSSSGSSK